MYIKRHRPRSLEFNNSIIIGVRESKQNANGLVVIVPIAVPIREVVPNNLKLGNTQTIIKVSDWSQRY
jgi:hypothetical protein